jgi:two-component system, response regulator RegA
MGAIRHRIRNVLVVDDEEAILTAWRRMISRDRTCVTARDPDAALQAAQRQAFDLAIIDMRLGTSSGIELIPQLKREQPDMTIVLCSGYLSVAATVAGMKAGADRVVFKPVTFRELLASLDKQEDDSSYVAETPTLARAEWEHIMRVLNDCNGNVSMAARQLGIYRSSLQRRLRKFAPRK